MKLKYKAYKLKKTEDYFKKNKILLLFNSINNTFTEETSNVPMLQGSKIYSISNNIMKKVLKSSIYLNLTLVINGPVVLVAFQLKSNANAFNLFKKLIFIKGNNVFLGLKLNRKIYSQLQLTSLSTLDYLENINVLHSSLNNFLGLFSNKCKIISK